ncbi:MAG: hypothetical protein JST84_25245 [Acidobacteria bacterium]|nr:hypothetical protein [Acidobacteriota bacterium]
MKKMLYLLTVSTLIVMSLATLAMAQNAEVGGTWNVTMNIPGSEPRKFPLALKQEGANLNATLGGEAGPLTGTVKGSDVTMKYTVKFQGNDLPITMTGKVNGNEMKGDVDFGGMAQETWMATRDGAAAKPAASSSSSAASAGSATWDLVYSSPVGEFPVTLTVKQDGENLSGMAKMGGPNPQEVPVKGTLKGDAVELRIVIKYEGNDLPITSKGKLTGNEVKGTADYGGLAEGEFKGKKN